MSEKGSIVVVRRALHGQGMKPQEQQKMRGGVRNREASGVAHTSCSQACGVSSIPAMWIPGTS